MLILLVRGVKRFTTVLKQSPAEAPAREKQTLKNWNL